MVVRLFRRGSPGSPDCARSPRLTVPKLPPTAALKILPSISLSKLCRQPSQLYIAIASGFPSALNGIARLHIGSLVRIAPNDDRVAFIYLCIALNNSPGGPIARQSRGGLFTACSIAAFCETAVTSHRPQNDRRLQFALVKRRCGLVTHIFLPR